MAMINFLPPLNNNPMEKKKKKMPLDPKTGKTIKPSKYAQNEINMYEKYKKIKDEFIYNAF